MTVPFPADDFDWVADPTGASFAFSFLPTAARYPHEDKARAGQWLTAFAFGHGCLAIFNDGYTRRLEWVNFKRFDVWRIAL